MGSSQQPGPQQGAAASSTGPTEGRLHGPQTQTGSWRPGVRAVWASRALGCGTTGAGRGWPLPARAPPRAAAGGALLLNGPASTPGWGRTAGLPSSPHPRLAGAKAKHFIASPRTWWPWLSQRGAARPQTRPGDACAGAAGLSAARSTPGCGSEPFRGGSSGLRPPRLSTRRCASHTDSQCPWAGSPRGSEPLGTACGVWGETTHPREAPRRAGHGLCTKAPPDSPGTRRPHRVPCGPRPAR